MKIKNLFYTILALLLLTNHASAVNSAGVAAIVNKEIITNSDLEKRVDLIIVLSNMQDSENTRQALRSRVLQNLVDEKLIEVTAATYKLSVDDFAVNDSIARIAASNRMKGPEELYQFLKSKGVSPDEFNKQTKHQLIQSKLISAIIEPSVNVSELELEETTAQIIKEIHSQHTESRYQLAEIVLYPDYPDADKLLSELSAQLSLGANFSSLAREFSQSQTAAKGGEIGWLLTSQLPPEISIIIEQTAVGSVTPPIKTQQGLFIIKVIDKQKDSTKTTSAIAPEQIRAILWRKKADLRLQTYLKNLRQKAFIEIK
jgi:peptidyl-prolyl cis-trans isomerase SurA